MARKVLISFLGTGPKGNLGKEKAERAYRPAKYHFGEGVEICTSFIADAIVQKYKIDSIILLGTTHSMWECVYEVFCNNTNQLIDDDYYLELADYCDNANSRSNLMIPHQENVEKILGNNSHVVLLKYGITEDEIRENISIVLGLEKYLNDKDELIVDITHSFRSLPLYIMNLLLYLKNVSSKKIKISKICYGMLDATDEFGYTPVVSLDGIMEVQDWITGAYNFTQYGNTYILSRLLNNDTSGNYVRIANAIKKFADVKNLNYLKEFRSGIGSLSVLTDKNNLPELGKEVIAPIMEKFTKRFPESLDQSTFQFRMAEWHCSHYNYGFALTVLIEAIVSYCCEINYSYLKKDNKDDFEYAINNKECRDLIKDALNKTYSDDNDYKAEVENTSNRLRIHFGFFNANSSYDEVLARWKITNTDRNNIVHNNRGGRPYEIIITDLKKNIQFFKIFLDRTQK